jgi:hypothetical protein
MWPFDYVSLPAEYAGRTYIPTHVSICEEGTHHRCHHRSANGIGGKLSVTHGS